MSQTITCHEFHPQHKMLRFLHSRNTHNNSHSTHTCLLQGCMFRVSLFIWIAQFFYYTNSNTCEAHSDFSVTLYQLYYLQRQNIQFKTRSFKNRLHILRSSLWRLKEVSVFHCQHCSLVVGSISIVVWLNCVVLWVYVCFFNWDVLWAGARSSYLA